jgi:hypothetical protein
MRPIFMPERARALSADWAPGPGVLVLFPPVARSFICRAVMPSSCIQSPKISINRQVNMCVCVKFQLIELTHEIGQTICKK